MPIRLGSRIFAPRPFTTLLTAALLALLVSLGRWQLHRAEEKRALFDAFDAGAAASRPIDAHTPALPRYREVEARGRYDATRQILLDNMSNAAGRAGYQVITPFALAGGGWLLVNRGWVPMGSSRAVLPPIAVPGDDRVVHGRTDELPRPGIRMGGPRKLAGPFPVVANFPTHADIEALLGEHDWAAAAPLLLLDAREPGGYLRQWAPPGFPPLRHVGYAVQWFALAAALAVLYLIANLRPSSGAADPRARP